MTYTPRSWADGELVAAEDLNRIEQGIDATDAALDGVTGLAARLAALEQATRDTGQRNIRGDLVNAETISPGGEATIQRIGTRVHLSLYDINFSDSGTVRVLTTLPIGFRPIVREGYSPLISSDIAKRAVVMPTGLYLYSVPTGGGQLRSVLSWTTDNAWPTTLPGTPA